MLAKNVRRVLIDSTPYSGDLVIYDNNLLAAFLVQVGHMSQCQF